MRSSNRLTLDSLESREAEFLYLKRFVITQTHWFWPDKHFRPSKSSQINSKGLVSNFSKNMQDSRSTASLIQTIRLEHVYGSWVFWQMMI